MNDAAFGGLVVTILIAGVVVLDKAASGNAVAQFAMIAAAVLGSLLSAALVASYLLRRYRERKEARTQ